MEGYPISKQFSDVFPKEILRFPPRREIDFSIELFPRSEIVSKDLYRMSTPNLVQLKLQLKKCWIGDTLDPLYHLGEL